MSQVNQEYLHESTHGFIMLALGITLPLFGLGGFLVTGAPIAAIGLVVLVLASIVIMLGLYMLEPNQAAVLTLFGAYRGTDRQQGLRWANPLYAKTRISLRARNFVSEKIKVNDKRGNPIEIAAAIVWSVEDTARAVFNIDSYETFVRTQSEAAVRHLASCYAYDESDEEHVGETLTLRGGGDSIGHALKNELVARLAPAGVGIDDAKLTHLAYAPEIAGAMLRRQQAEAVISARRKIVQGAVDMVEMALQRLSEKKLLELDEERRAAMVSNLLVVLVGEKDVSPVINSGTLYN